jgi:pimeloyl-ACP methyl ester carboxylesterase
MNAVSSLSPVLVVREQAVLLGERKSLIGILSQSSTPDAGLPAVVILNAGIVHRVGPNRMFVVLARRLAAMGHTVLRFDFSGIGDSDTRNDGREPLEATLADLREVLDGLESTRGIRKVILVGLCSGADHAVIYAGDDPRITGIVMIDPTIPPTLKHRIIHLAGRVFRSRPWVLLATLRHPLLLRAMRRRRAEAAAEDGEYRRPDAGSPEVRAFLQQAYAKAHAAGVHFLTVLTGDLGSMHNYREQLLDAFPTVPLKERMDLEYYRRADHTFTAEADREWLLGRIEKWMAERTRPA